MKAIVCTQYGSPDVMQIQEVSQPVPKPNEVLIKVYATTVTAGDCELRRFDMPALFWLPLRLYIGITKPRKGVFGQELAGEVEAVGNLVKGFKKGDPVFAPTTIHFGAYAHYVSLPEGHLTKFNPDAMTFASAATIPTGGINGLHFVTKANIKPGESVLINGAGGSIGTYALQFAKAHGAQVTCVDSTIKLDMLHTLGADEVIDYTKHDFTRIGKAYDVIIDIVGKSSFSRSVKSLKPNGRYVLGNPTFTGMLRALGTSMISNKKVIFQFADYRPENLVFIKDQIESGRVKPVIDKVYLFDQIPEAHRYVDAGLKCGNVIIMVNQDVQKPSSV